MYCGMCVCVCARTSVYKCSKSNCWVVGIFLNHWLHKLLNVYYCSCFACVSPWSVCVSAGRMPRHIHGSERTTFGVDSTLLPWDPGIELQLLYISVSTFTSWVTFLARATWILIESLSLKAELDGWANRYLGFACLQVPQHWSYRLMLHNKILYVWEHPCWAIPGLAPGC